LEAARRTLGDIELDAASSEQAQATVQARRFLTQDDDALQHEWRGKVWLNPPYSQPLIQRFVEKLAAEYRAGRVSEAILLTHNHTDTAWFHQIFEAASAICFTRGRVKFQRFDGVSAAPVQGQAFTYFGSRPEAFAVAFSQFGTVIEVRTLAGDRQ
jgi:phage N-6-adenine-methyltransferase